jgi:hypothetical protein
MARKKTKREIDACNVFRKHCEEHLARVLESCERASKELGEANTAAYNAYCAAQGIDEALAAKCKAIWNYTCSAWGKMDYAFCLVSEERGARRKADEAEYAAEAAQKRLDAAERKRLSQAAKP